jgi:Kef-type K+ transport system membrane component KefB
MDIAKFFLVLILILASAKLLAELFAHFRLPSVLGEVLAGVIVGPSLLGWVRPDEMLYMLAEIGILLLLFEVGLETDVAQLLSVGTKSVMVAATGVVVPALLAYAVCVWMLDIPFLPSTFVAGTLVATSIGISLRVLAELKQHETRTAKIVLGAAVLDDIAGVLILTLLFDLAVTKQVDVAHTATVFGYIVLFMLAAPILAKLLVPTMRGITDYGKTMGMFPTLAIILILAFSVVAHKIGAPFILGAFAAGIALSRHFFIPFGQLAKKHESFAEKVEHQLRPISGLFVPIFFFVVGASMNLRAIDFGSALFWKMAGLLTAAAIVGKMASGIFAEGTFREKLFCGIAMVPRGEVGLIFAEVGRKNAVLDEAMYATVVFVVAITTLLAPIALRYLPMDGPESGHGRDKVPA